MKYFVDGQMGAADVFIDPQHNGTPNAVKRVWRTVLVGGKSPRELAARS